MSKHWILLVVMAAAALVSIGHRSQVSAQVLPRAKMIWLDEGDSTRSAPMGTRYFRGTFTERYPVAEAEIRIACDDEFVLFVNGKEADRGTRWQDGKVIDVTRLLRAGKNVVAVEATNRGGPAALVAWLARRTVPGNHYTFLTDSSWKCSKEAAKNWREVNFDDSRWSAVKVIGDFGKVGPWPEVTWIGIPAKDGKADLGRFRIKPGFTIDLVAEPSLTGSIVRMTFDTRGRPVISRENGPILILVDPDGQGKFRKAKEYTRKVRNCQGILAYDPTTFYLVGDGPQGTGLYRLKDTDGDDVADQVELILRFRGGMSEHGPHAVLAGPDGFLYVVCGNHAGVTAKPDVNSPVEKMYEGDLLRRYEDPSGHAAGIKLPGGTTWRLDPDGKHLTLENGGFRNHYDIAFNSLNEIFTFDSDMELQEFLPFYHPVRVMHCPPGADFGWRSNDGKWPPYYVDALPALVDIGRGSPTGVVFYNHQHFPPEYQDAFLMSDWSYGRIFALKLRRAGATFKADVEEFVTGKPLNVTDIGVAPDGSVFFCTGGRGTEGGIYRIRSTKVASKDTPPVAPPSQGGDRGEVGAAAVQAALDQPQPQSAWGREAVRCFKAKAGDKWEPELERAAKDSHAPAARRIRALSYLMQFGPEPSRSLARHLAATEDPEVRAQAAVLLARHPREAVSADLIALLGDSSPIVQRRAAEGLIRTQTPAAFEKLRPLLASSDPFLRYAGRLALERTDPAQWRDAVLADPNPRVPIMGLVSLNKLGKVAADPAVATAAFEKELSLLRAKLPSEDELDTLRSLQLTLINTKGGPRPAHLIEAIGKVLLDRFPAGERSLDRELARTVAFLQVPGAIDKLLTALKKHSTEAMDQRADAIHYARCLAAITRSWTPDQRRRSLAWFDLSKDWKGGHSYRGHINYYLRDTQARLTESDSLALVRERAKFPRAAASAVDKIDEKPAYNWTYDQLLAFLESDGRKGSVETGRKIFEKVNCARCHKFEQVGGGLGPDLTTLSSRFKRKDILEAIVYPSRVISDQYQSVLVTTKSGRVINGMKAPDEGDEMVLLLSDASTLKLPKAEVDEIAQSKQSIMPDGPLNHLTLQEIAGLFAFLESGRGTPAVGNGKIK